MQEVLGIQKIVKVRQFWKRGRLSWRPLNMCVGADKIE